MSGLLQEFVRRVSGLRVFLDGLQEEGITRDLLHRHHQKETQRGGVDLGPGEMGEKINK